MMSLSLKPMYRHCSDHKILRLPFQHFKLLVEDLHVKGEAKVKKAMKESFRILADVSIIHTNVQNYTFGARPPQVIRVSLPVS